MKVLIILFVFILSLSSMASTTLDKVKSEAKKELKLPLSTELQVKPYKVLPIKDTLFFQVTAGRDSLKHDESYLFSFHQKTKEVTYLNRTKGLDQFIAYFRPMVEDIKISNLQTAQVFTRKILHQYSLSPSNKISCKKQTEKVSCSILSTADQNSEVAPLNFHFKEN